MKDTNFLKTNLFVNKGIYDNQIIYENTLESFKEAIKNKYSIILSVNLTKDNIIIIYYDNDLTRLMNLKDKINSITYEELNYLCSYHVPTLEETLKLINGETEIILDVRTTSHKYYLEKTLAAYLDNYPGSFGILSKYAKTINWFNKNRPNFIVGEILTKKRNLSLNNIIANCCIHTDFKSININYYDIYKIKNIKEDSLVLGYLIDNQEKYLVYKDIFDNLFIDNVYELQMTEEIL